MTVKNCRVQIETLAAKVAAYRRGGMHMIDCLCQIKDKLARILPDDFHFQEYHIGYTSNLRSTNVGHYGAALCYVPTHAENRGDWMPIESDGWEQAGASYFLHDNFNVSVTQPNRLHIKDVARKMPSFVAALLKHIEEQTEQNEEATKLLLRMLEASKTESE